LKPSEHNSGYIVFQIRDGGKRKQLRVHRFVMECYLGREIKKNMVINHIDGNKYNNSINNLEEITYSENTRHAIKLGLKKPCKGESNGMSYLTEDIVREIIRDIMLGLSNTEIANKFRIDEKHTSLIRNKKRWQHIFLEEEFKDYKIIKASKETSIPNVIKLKVKYLIANTQYTFKKIADEVGIDPSLVSRYSRGLIWKNI
jgi:hypothetical protein